MHQNPELSAQMPFWNTLGISIRGNKIYYIIIINKKYTYYYIALKYQDNRH